MLDHYLNICADERYEGHMDSTEALRHIEAIAAFQEKTPNGFEFQDGNTWFLVTLLHCDTHGNHSSEGALPEKINLIEVISRSESDQAMDFAENLAKRMGWIVIDVTLE